MSIDPADFPPRACKFCAHCKRAEGRYECRYNPPKATGFPKVAWNDWCRLYKPDVPFIEKYLSKKSEEQERIAAVRKSMERKG